MELVHTYTTLGYTNNLEQSKLAMTQPGNSAVTLHEIVIDANISFSDVASPPAYEIGHASGLGNSLRGKTPKSIA